MFGPKEIMVVLVVLLIVLMVFGPKRIKSLGAELGNAIKGFRNAVKDKDAESAATQSVAHEPATSDATGAAANQKQNV